MNNPNNCSTCTLRQPNVKGAHCYMWKDAPTTVCMSHSGRKISIGTIGHISSGKSSLLAALITAAIANGAPVKDKG